MCNQLNDDLAECRESRARRPILARDSETLLGDLKRLQLPVIRSQNGDSIEERRREDRVLHGCVRGKKGIEDIEDIIGIIFVLCCKFRIHPLMCGFSFVERAPWRCSQTDDAVVAWVIGQTEAIVHHH